MTLTCEGVLFTKWQSEVMFLFMSSSFRWCSGYWHHCVKNDTIVHTTEELLACFTALCAGGCHSLVNMEISGCLRDHQATWLIWAVSQLCSSIFTLLVCTILCGKKYCSDFFFSFIIVLLCTLTMSTPTSTSREVKHTELSLIKITEGRYVINYFYLGMHHMAAILPAFFSNLATIKTCCKKWHMLP